MIHGITVELAVREQTGVDGFGVPTYTETWTPVENVLVAPASDTDIINSTELHGGKSTYVLGVPKGDAHNWKNTRVRFWGKIFQTFGNTTQGIDENIPLDWNKKVLVELIE